MIMITLYSVTTEKEEEEEELYRLDKKNKPF